MGSRLAIINGKARVVRGRRTHNRAKKLKVFIYSWKRFLESWYKRYTSQPNFNGFVRVAKYV